MMTDREKLTVILVQILDFSGLKVQKQKKIYEKITSSLYQAAEDAASEVDEDMEAYLVWQIKQIVNDQIIDVSRN
ncbi:hypothetical protein F1728_06670 [Gimesia benthica]|uniref:Uncharacterized protein n=1 Tax=Gimesia benthica TaxID=2608982 RepID=A0A6I6A8J6_9PLAN|nr:hypothetical protein [Gimesia benthica]QGQ22376.1 hypothetical protein F1728_06670 [Gimesia benthica]